MLFGVNAKPCPYVQDKRIEYIVSEYIYSTRERCKGTISLKYGRTVLEPEITIEELQQFKRTSVGGDFANDTLFVLQAIEESEDDGNSDDNSDDGSDGGSYGDTAMSEANGASDDDCDGDDGLIKMETSDASDSGCDVGGDAPLTDSSDVSDDDSDF